MEASKIKYYDASPNPDHFTKEQIERVVEGVKEMNSAKQEDGTETSNVVEMKPTSR